MTHLHTSIQAANRHKVKIKKWRRVVPWINMTRKEFEKMKRHELVRVIKAFQPFWSGSAILDTREDRELCGELRRNLAALAKSFNIKRPSI